MRSEIWNGSERSRERSLASMKPPPANPAGRIGRRSEHEAAVAASRALLARRALHGNTPLRTARWGPHPAPTARVEHSSVVQPAGSHAVRETMQRCAVGALQQQLRVIAARALRHGRGHGPAHLDMLRGGFTSARASLQKRECRFSGGRGVSNRCKATEWWPRCLRSLVERGCPRSRRIPQ